MNGETGIPTRPLPAAAKMNILVINGSPKGEYSVTLQTCLYLEILHPEHSFACLNAGKQIKALEEDFSKAKEMLEQADVILFSYPVYTFLIPSQLHRLIELLKENRMNLRGKYVSQITTSKHFYDITAHEMIRENCQELGMKYVKGLSADMDDLTTEKGQGEAEAFFRYLMWCVENGISEPFPGPGKPANHVPVTVPELSGEKGGDIVIVADLAENDTQLNDMILRFRAVCPGKTRVVNIHDFPFRGGCISCFHCAADGTCVYQDGFSRLLRDEIQTADAIVIAFSIQDHSMGSIFKTYDDRQFCNGHRTVTMGKPFGYLVSGNLSQENNLRMVMEARAEVGGNFLAGIATDEFSPDSEIDSMAARLWYAARHQYTQPANFYGVGGMKIFRDLIWLMQGMMRADHRFYKAHGQYDFPQKKMGTMLAMYGAGYVMGNKKLKAKLGGKLNDGMIAPYTKVLEQARKKMGQAGKS